MKVSVIIPTFNEEKVIKDCLDSLAQQSYENMEIIAVDDGSSDRTVEIISDLQAKIPSLKLLKQHHLGAGAARNLGAKQAEGEILVFVDADMVFDRYFIAKLVEPINQKKTLGTFSKEEYVLNKDNIWSRCWNFNKGLPFSRMHPKNYPDLQPVFRAILKKEFEKVEGFSLIGYVDDHTLAEKLGQMAVVAPGAIFYHRNPDNLGEIFRQARWIGKSEYKKRKIKNENLMRLVALVRYSLPVSLIKAVVGSFSSRLGQYFLFKLLYDLGIEISLLNSFLGEHKYR